MILTYKYRLLPTKRQHVALTEILETQRILYNAALEERIGCYRKAGKWRSFIDQAKALTECRASLPDMAAIPVNLQRWTLKRLDDAYAGFFRRLKTNGKAGFPRFRSKARWNSFGFMEFSGVRFDGKGLRFKGLPGRLRVHLHRALPDNIRSAVFRRDAKGWFICFQVAIEAAAKRVVENAIGLDLGLKAFVHQSDGVSIPAPNIARRAGRSMRIRQRALARCQRGSKRRQKVRAMLARAHAGIKNTRDTWLHQHSARMARSYDLIAVEDLKVANMVRNPHLARSISDAAWSKFLSLLEYKVEKTGAHFIRVNPKNTTQNCSGCGVIVRKGLADREHSCPECGLVLDRDHNAALNILRLGVLAQGGANVAGCGKRSRGNISLEGISN